MHLREACLLFASAITKSSLFVRQNDKAHAHQITLLSLFNDIHNILVAHVVYTRPQTVVTKSSGFAYTIIESERA